jgi:hypothetical protein
MKEIKDEKKIMKNHLMNINFLHDDQIVEVKFLIKDEYFLILTNTIEYIVVNLIKMNYLIFVYH